MGCAPVRRDNPRACTTISSVDLAQYGVSLAKDWVSVKCGTNGTWRRWKYIRLSESVLIHNTINDSSFK